MNAQGWLRALLGIALLGLVASCDLIRDVLSDDEAETAAQAAPEPEPSHEPQSEVASAPPPAATRPPRERPAPPPEFDPRRLVGLDKDETVALLGQPASVRDQPPSTVWTYKTRDCALDVFFYMDLATRAFRVLTYDVTTDGKSADARRVCLNRLRAASRAP